MKPGNPVGNGSDLMIELLQGRCQPERRYPDYTGSSNNKRISSLDDCGSFYEGSFFRYVLINVTTNTINFYEERNYYGKKIIYIRICY